MTLTLFKEGKSIEEIAEIRTLAVSTIENHLALFIGMELSIEEFLTKEDLEIITPVIQPFLEAENPPFRIIFDKLGGKYSFGQLRMAFNHCKH
ncbi:MAG: helix-turn-helix domain-containing protein [Candidatus Azobacteroides sp.]|nr:helix-turn-helix domain-containing protein [Candidatus Azobacteroides sp.]